MNVEIIYSLLFVWLFRSSYAIIFFWFYYVVVCFVCFCLICKLRIIIVMFTYSYCYVLSVLGILFYFVVLITVFV